MSGIAPTSNQFEHDPLAKMVIHVINAMQADFGRLFTKQFDDPEVLKNYKRRLYAKLKGFPLNAIVSGYENHVETNTKYIPTVPELVASIQAAVKQDQTDAKNKAEAERLANLPAPTIECNPLEMLAKAKLASNGAVKETDDERLKRKAEMLQSHNAVIALHSHKIKQRYAQPEHYCSVNGCRRTGTISAGLNGASSWYCAKHFRLAN